MLFRSDKDYERRYFYKDFVVESIITKAITVATQRIASLENKGYVQLHKKFIIWWLFCENDFNTTIKYFGGETVINRYKYY